MLEIVRRTQRNVKRSTSGEMALRRTAAGMFEAERQFRKIIGYRELRHPRRRNRTRPQPSPHTPDPDRGGSYRRNRLTLALAGVQAGPNLEAERLVRAQRRGPAVRAAVAR